MIYIIKFITDEVPQSCWTQWINLNAREGHSINILKHWKYTMEKYFVRGCTLEFYRNRTAVKSKRKFRCKHLSILIALFSEFYLEESYCGDRKVLSLGQFSCKCSLQQNKKFDFKVISEDLANSHFLRRVLLSMTICTHFKRNN